MQSNVRHEVFISFYHHDDQYYKDYIDVHFNSLIINKSVKDGEYDPDNSDEYVKRLIREEKISDSSVIVVLVGKNTYKRKHVDWEIYAGLRASINGRAGLLGILLPSYNANTGEIPKRLNDNVISGYAKLYKWSYAINNFSEIIQTAFDDRLSLCQKADNSRLQMQKNSLGK